MEVRRCVFLMHHTKLPRCFSLPSLTFLLRSLYLESVCIQGTHLNVTLTMHRTGTRPKLLTPGHNKRKRPSRFQNQVDKVHWSPSFHGYGSRLVLTKITASGKERSQLDRSTKRNANRPHDKLDKNWESELYYTTVGQLKITLQHMLDESWKLLFVKDLSSFGAQVAIFRASAMQNISCEIFATTWDCMFESDGPYPCPWFTKRLNTSKRDADAPDKEFLPQRIENITNR